MARGRIRLEWDQTCLLWWTLVEINRDPNSEPVDPLKFHPLHAKPDDEQEGPNMGLWHRVTQNANVVKIDHAKLRSYPSGQGVHQAHDQ